MRAILAEIIIHMIGIDDVVIIVLMTGPAVRRSTGIPVGVAVDTVER